jgi:hypothetical protein
MSRMTSSRAFVAVALLALLTGGCHQRQTYQGVQLRVLGVEHRDALRSPGPIVEVRPGEGREFVVVSLEITWNAAQRELAVDRTQVKLSDTGGGTYNPAVWALEPLSSGGKSTTVEKINFAIPLGRRLKTFCVGQTCFDL